MAKGPKLKKAKNGIFTIYLRYDGLFVSTPLQYVDGEMREISDINFDGMSFDTLVEIVKRLIPAMEVRNGDEAYCVNLQNKVCSCRMWELSGVPCVHAVAGYLHLGKEIDDSVSFWYSQEAWFNAYQFSIKPVLGSKYWKRTNDVPPLPPLLRKMPGRPQKQRRKSPTENNSTQVSRVGRQMTCSNCWQKGHNKAGCKNETQPKPQTNNKASRGGLGSRGGGRGDRSGRGGGTSGGGNGGTGEGTGERGGGNGRRGGGNGRRGGGNGGQSNRGVGQSSRVGSSSVGEPNDGFCTAEEEYQYNLDMEAFMDVMHQQELEAKLEYLNASAEDNHSHQLNASAEDNHSHQLDVAAELPTQQSVILPVEQSEDGKGKQRVDEPTKDGSAIKPLKRTRNNQKWMEKAYTADGQRIYHKNRGRSERIKSIHMSKAYKFDQFGTGSTPEKAFDVADYD